MKRAMNFAGIESFVFGTDNKLRIFPPNSYKFNPKDHIVIDEVQECLLDNFWFQYNNKREDKGYMLSILNSLAEYFHMINELLPTADVPEKVEQENLYLIFNGKKPGLYTSFEQLAMQKLDAEMKGGSLTWKKFTNIDEALSKTRMALGVNYYIEPTAKEYIQNFKKAHVKKNPVAPVVSKIKEEGTSKKPTYKEYLVKGVDPLDGSYIDMKIEEKFESIAPEWKKDIKEDILNEIRKEFNAKFEEIKKSYEEKYEIPFSDEDIMDISGHGQNLKEENN